MYILLYEVHLWVNNVPIHILISVYMYIDISTHVFVFIFYILVLGAGVKVLAVEGLQGPPVWGASRAARCWTQPIPASSDRPTTWHGWALQLWVGGLGGKTFRKGQTHTIGCEGRGDTASTEGREAGWGHGGAPLQVPLQPVERLRWSNFILKDCRQWKDRWWSRGTVWGGGRRGRDIVQGQTATPWPYVAWRVCEGGGRGEVFAFFASRYLNVFQLAMIEVNFSQVGTLLPTIVIDKWSVCLYLDPRAFSSPFLPLSCWEWE